MKTIPARYIVAGITDERDSCDCCGKTGLKRVVVLLDLDSSDFVFFGTTCAARNTGRDNIVAAAKQNGKVTTPARALIEHYGRRANFANKRAVSILKMANGCANVETRREADVWFAKAVEYRRLESAARTA